MSPNATDFISPFYLTDFFFKIESQKINISKLQSKKP